MHADRASSASIADEQLKANTLNTSRDPAIDSSDRKLGRDNASDRYGHNNYRARSRSPSPYRRKPTHSPSPYRRTRDRSPSPYRHGRSNRGGHDQDSRYKRKASPPSRSGRPDKRRPDDRRNWNAQKDIHTGRRQPGAQKDRVNPSDQRYPSPISYADNEHYIPVPGFPSLQNGRSNDRQQEGNGYKNSSHQSSSVKSRADVKQPSEVTVRSNQSKDVDMASAEDESDYSVTLAVEDVAPTKESREEKMRKWAAKRAQVAAQQANGTTNVAQIRQQAILNNASENTTPNLVTPAGQAGSIDSPPASSPSYIESAPASPDIMIIDKQDGVGEGTSPSAANYDPTQDMLEDRARAVRKVQQPELSSTAYDESDSRLQALLPTIEQSAPTKPKKKEYDMFASDDEEGEDEEQNSIPAKGTVLNENLLDNWDDTDHYYKIIGNELVHAGQYRMIKPVGRGVFANVAQAEDIREQTSEKTGKLVAIKIIRKIELMRKASQKEVDFLKRLNESDPQDKRHIIRLLGWFDHKGHLCIVFEHMAKNLRDLLKEETNGHGLALHAVKTYARQMFSALQHLRDCQVIHLDLKPDNILVSHDKKSIKLCDLGTAVDQRDVLERTEYLVSRFYRAPEIVLDMEYGYAIDMWAIGCTIYELWTGKILFTGRSNNQMIKSFLECLGWPSEKLLKKGKATNVLSHFELGPPLKFFSREVDPQGNLFVRKIEQQKKIPRDLKTRVHDAARGITEGRPSTTELSNFVDLLSATLNWNVEKRIQPKEALNHKLFSNKALVPRIKPALIKRGGSALKR